MAAKKVAVTGAAGNISYSLLFRIAAGGLYGPDTKVSLSLLEVDVPAVAKAMEGVKMELEDGAFALLESCTTHTDAAACFADADAAFLVGARPRSKGMERKDLLEANAAIFKVQGQALAAGARPDAKVLVVGNPANTNCLIAQRNAAGMDPACFTAMTRLDQNRAAAQVAAHAGAAVGEVRNVVVWGNHSATQFPDIAHATVAGKPAAEAVDAKWYKEEMIGVVQQRGAAIIAARGLSSAASAASAALDHMHDWIHGTPEGTWVSMAVVSGGEYGIEEGLVYSYPCTCAGGKWSVVPDLARDDFAAEMMKATEAELREERDAVAALLG
ncbi:MAG: malate dehydrogenase [Betaproteobacteria bacterium AqS2]|uniref:Malate dehydrogenase n=1 Tax=Candidatus Amphirhobacter heronislandensis TaxID=1732024 RepID=A0A930UGZ3_9GAMM|nr:malate dehydrogenase [Betaproteobacteria bacterium AqS2]